jgi:competence protein ComFC
MILPGNKLLNYALDAVFPRQCVTCATEGSLLCAICKDSWRHDPPEPGPDHLAFFAYANPVVRKLICAWKYEYDHSAFAILRTEAQVFMPEFIEGAKELGIQAVVPLPLSARRWRERGFNQSEMIAHWIAEELGVPVASLLQRSHRQGHQADRSTEERRQAMLRNPFFLESGVALPEAILLVDDVFTTGATMSAARSLLTGDGKTKVFGFTLAQG